MIGRKAVLAFLLIIVKNALGYVGLFFIARLMGPHALGILGFGFAYAGIFNFIADMGFGVAHIKRISEGRDESACVATYALIRSALTLVMAATVVASVLVYKYVLHRSFEDPQHEYVIYLAVCTYAALNLAGIFGTTFAARKQTAKQMIPEVAGKVVDTSLKALVALVGLTAFMLAGAALAGAVVTLLGYVVLRGVSFKGKPDRQMVRAYVAFALPVMVVVSANAVTENLDQLMIHFFWNALELGYYVGGAKIALIFTLAGVAVGTLLFPTISSTHGRGDLAGVRRVTFRAEHFICLMLLPAGVFVTFYRTFVTRLVLGGQFDRAVPILAVLTWTMIVRVASTPYATQIIGTGRERLSASLSVLLMTLNVLMNLVFVPSHIGGIRLFGLGGLGAALATLLSTIVMGIVYRVFAFRITGTGLNRRLFKHLLAAALAALTMHAAAPRIDLPGLAGAVLPGVLGLVVWTVSMLASRTVTRSDLRYLLNAFSPSGMASYVRNELSPDREPEKDDSRESKDLP